MFFFENINTQQLDHAYVLAHGSVHLAGSGNLRLHLGFYPADSALGDLVSFGPCEFRRGLHFQGYGSPAPFVSIRLHKVDIPTLYASPTVTGISFQVCALRHH
jgi:hypothetical protein